MKKIGKNMMEKKKIERMTQEGKDLLYKDLGKIEEEINALKKSKKELGKKEENAISAIDEKIARLEVRKNNLLERIANVEIIELKNMDDLHININDLVMLQMIFDKDDIEDMTLKLVGGDATIFDGRVSVNSPLGQAMYGEIIGSTVSYMVQGKEVNVKLLKKVMKEDK